MGTVRFNKGRGWWYVDYTAADGTRVRQRVGPGEEGRRRAKEILKHREAESQLGIHNLPASQTMRFEEFAEDWLARLAGRNLAPKTEESYIGLVRNHLTPYFGERRLGVITRRDVELFLAEKAKTHAPKTVAYALTLLKHLLADAMEHSHLQENPAAKVRPPVRPDREEAMHVLAPAEVARLLDAAEAPWRLLYLLAVETGLRRGELLGLRWGDFDLAAGRLYVRRSLLRVRDGDRYVVRESPLKTRSSRRVVRLSRRVIDALLVHPSSDIENDFVFRSRSSTALDPDNIGRAFRRHLTLAELPTIRFHDLRHTSASLGIAAGEHAKALQARLGHSSITVTMDRYVHLMPDAFEGTEERLDALLVGPNVGNNSATTKNADPSESLKPAL